MASKKLTGPVLISQLVSRSFQKLVATHTRLDLWIKLEIVYLYMLSLIYPPLHVVWHSLFNINNILIIHFTILSLKIHCSSNFIYCIYYSSERWISRLKNCKMFGVSVIYKSSRKEAIYWTQAPKKISLDYLTIQPMTAGWNRVDKCSSSVPILQGSLTIQRLCNKFLLPHFQVLTVLDRLNRLRHDMTL